MTKRSGFTLIELLGVLILIAILMAFLLPAVSSVRKSVQDQVTKAQMSSYAAALTDFHNAYGCYPPSSITLYNNAADWRADPSSLAKMLRMFPNFDPNGPLPWDFSLAQPSFGPKPGCRVSHQGSYPAQLNGAECLVFFLGGPLYGTVYDSSGNILKWGQPIGFSKNPALPLSINPKEARTTFIQLDSKKFTDVDDDGIPELADSLPNQSFPMIYGMSDGQGYIPSDFILWFDPSNVLPPVGLAPYTRAGVEINKPSYQIISPGRDALYGAGGDYDLNKGDNITNF